MSNSDAVKINKTYGYIWVSAIGQSESKQLADLLKRGVPERNIFVDKLSGRDFNRPNYQSLKRKLKENDILVIKSIDSLGNNYSDIHEEWRIITKVIKADIVILDMPLLDTRRDKDLIGTLIADIVLQLLSYVAENELAYIKRRQADGIAVARAKGIHLGRYADQLPDGFYEAYQSWLDGRITRAQAAEKLGVTKNQFDWMKLKYKKRKG